MGRALDQNLRKTLVCEDMYQGTTLVVPQGVKICRALAPAAACVPTRSQPGHINMMNPFKLRFFLYIFLLMSSTLHSQTPQAATMIVTNAKVWTVDKQHPTAEAVAVIGDRIVAVGSSAEVDQIGRAHV